MEFHQNLRMSPGNFSEKGLIWHGWSASVGHDELGILIWLPCWHPESDPTCCNHSTVALLPLFRDSAHTVAMIKLAVTIVCDGTMDLCHSPLSTHVFRGCDTGWPNYVKFRVVVVLLYNRTRSIMEINAARKELFTKKSRILENLPPILPPLKLHIKRLVTNSINGTIP